jgi:hypothetical protein
VVLHILVPVSFLIILFIEPSVLCRVGIRHTTQWWRICLFAAYLWAFGWMLILMDHGFYIKTYPHRHRFAYLRGVYQSHFILFLEINRDYTGLVRENLGPVMRLGYYWHPCNEPAMADYDQ